MNKPRRPKGTGSITYLGTGRRRPYLATYAKKTIGTFKSSDDAEIGLLKHQLEINESYPKFIGDDDTIKTEYAKFILPFQKKGVLSLFVEDFEDMDFYNDLFKDRIISLGGGTTIMNSKQEIIVSNVPTFAELWEIEYERVRKINSKSWAYCMSTAYSNLKPLHHIKVNMIKTAELQSAFDERMAKPKCGMSTLRSMINVCHYVFRYAMKYDYIEKDYTQFINVAPTSEKKNNRKPFTPEEIKLLISNDSDIARKILLYIFTGARPIELIKMKKSDIFLDDNYMVGGVKTAAGKGRIIPIHPIIKSYIQDFVKGSHDYLFPNVKDTHAFYKKYCKEYHILMEKLKLDHAEPYDTRHTFSTLAKLSKMDVSARKKIMGHSCKDITDDIYTHEPKEYLYQEIMKISIS